METTIGIFFLATLIEGLIKYLFGEAKPSESGEVKERGYLRYVSLVLGIGAAVAYRVDIPAMLGLVSSYSLVGFVVSGLIIGRGANYVNDIFAMVRGVGK